MVFARCIALEVDYGVQPFIVPIRDLETHECLPGIEIGDMGVKLGYNNIDNGYLIFTNYRVKRTCMMAKFASIGKKGMLKLHGNPKMIYQVMVRTRLAIISCVINVYQRVA